ncbi:MAG: type IV pilus modification protein PilV [Halioglobus sp.]|nr:type IV pilus modification protein PilV [Halioglobus sp.]
MNKPFALRRDRGFTLIEVLVTVIILAVGLLGLAGLQMSSMNNQLESYQRAQAMLMLEDMANRIRSNAVAAKAGAYAAASDYGLRAEEDCSTKVLTAERDLCEWNLALAGSGVTLDTKNAGSVLGARGCVESIPGTANGEINIRLTIAWQGMSKTRSPASDCGEDQYGDDDAYRRTASLDTVLANLTL